MEELLLSNSGEDEFEEILKLLAMKLWDDMTENVTVSGFDNGGIVERTNETLKKITYQWPGVLKDASINISG
jgi:hypothetical protein